MRRFVPEVPGQALHDARKGCEMFAPLIVAETRFFIVVDELGIIERHGGHGFPTAPGAVLRVSLLDLGIFDLLLRLTPFGGLEMAKARQGELWQTFKRAQV